MRLVSRYGLQASVKRVVVVIGIERRQSQVVPGCLLAWLDFDELTVRVERVVE